MMMMKQITGAKARYASYDNMNSSGKKAIKGQGTIESLNSDLQTHSMVSVKEAEEAHAHHNNLVGLANILRVYSPDQPSSMTFRGISGMPTGTFENRTAAEIESDLQVLSR